MKYLITSALPYANGQLHFGHLAGAYLPADVITRHLRMMGNTVKYICGTDEHGVAIMLNAKKQGIDYQSYVDQWHKEDKELFFKYQVEFDFFGQTSKEYHHKEVLEWFNLLHQKGYIAPKDDQQLYCNDCKNHLPDRFVEGTCYECDYPNARGDECPNCGLWIEPSRLKNPICKICGSKNIKEVTVTQYYLLLSKFSNEFREWFKTKESFWRNTVYPYVDSLTKDGLKDRAISRDLDWGIDVPLPEAKGKKLYVWFDAPIGYVSNLKEHLKESGSKDDYLKDWWKNDDVRIVNFIGKDNIIFHAVIFPMMSMASGKVNPVTDLPANQYLTLDGKQFSKSSGCYIDALDAVNRFGVDALRYYLISIIPENSDSSFTWEQFGQRVNGELANNIGNLVNRTLKFWHKNWPDGIEKNILAKFFTCDESKKLQEMIASHHKDLKEYQIRRGLEDVMSIGREANNFITVKAPWTQFKTSPDEAKETIAYASVYILVLGALFSSYLPTLSDNILKLFPFTDAKKGAQLLYQGEILKALDLLPDQIVLTSAPEALVQKIELEK